MATPQIEYTTIDKSEWKPGPWHDEPDKAQWSDEATGLPCLAVRGPGGHWCGYVGVAEGHPWFGLDYDNDAVAVDIHGGLTFSNKCAGGDERSTICHVPGEGDPDHVWWLGFDCAHLGDLSPKYAPRGPSFHDEETYRALPYVRDEVARLAEQIAAA